MGYWGVTADSSSLFTAVHEDTEYLWGDGPADCLDDGLTALISRLHDSLGRWPTVDEVEAVKATAPEMLTAIAKARDVFRADLDREMTDVELQAGLRFCDTEIGLDSEQRSTFGVGDRVRWAVMTNAGGWQEIDYIAEGVVRAVEFREYPSSWSSTTHLKAVLIVDCGDQDVEVDKAYATAVLPGDKTIEQVNADRELRDR